MRRILSFCVTYTLITVGAVVIAAIVGGLLWVVYPSDQSLLGESATVVSRLLGENPDRWERFVFNYQTLIGGMLAIVAAVITVIAMMVVDQRQGARHNELIRLGVRADRIRLERLLVPQFEQLSASFQLIGAFEIAAGICELPVGDPFEDLTKRLSDLRDAVVQIRICIASQAWTAAEDLFNGELSDACRELDRSTRLFLSRIDEAGSDLYQIKGAEVEHRRLVDGERAAKFRAKLIEDIDAVRDSVVSFGADMQRILASLRTLSKEYEINLT